MIQVDNFRSIEMTKNEKKFIYIFNEKVKDKFIVFDHRNDY